MKKILLLCFLLPAMAMAQTSGYSLFTSAFPTPWNTVSVNAKDSNIAANAVTSVAALQDSLKIMQDSVTSLQKQLQQQKDAISYEDYACRFKLIKIKRYVRLCEQRATNKKYFFGWVRRTLKN
jgi:hypothetical protein